MSARAAAAGMAVILLSCEGAYLTAPPGSDLILVANPERIAAHGGVAELTAIVTEPAGTDVPDGTVVLWTTNLGQIQRETRTVRGIARNRLVSDSRSGIARVRAQSGAASIPPTPEPSATPGPTPTPTPSPTAAPTLTTAFSGLSARGPSLSSGLQNFNEVDVFIGNQLVASVRLRANPTRITNSSSTQVTATVLDTFGNPVPNVPVFFEVITDRDFEFFDSAGAAVHTNNNGEAVDVLRTRRPTTGPITVRACAAAASATGFICSPNFVIPIA